MLAKKKQLLLKLFKTLKNKLSKHEVIIRTVLAVGIMPSIIRTGRRRMRLLGAGHVEKKNAPGVDKIKADITRFRLKCVIYMLIQIKIS